MEIMRKREKSEQNFEDIKQVIFCWGNGDDAKLGFGNYNN